MHSLQQKVPPYFTHGFERQALLEQQQIAVTDGVWFFNESHLVTGTISVPTRP
jgi:hypothetical protein